MRSSPDTLPLDKSSRTIRDMFAGVAPRYDLLNHLLSGALDVVWRRRVAAALTAGDRRAVLDLCCGTGDQMTALAAHGAGVTGADFCLPMLARARPKLGRHGAGPPRLAAADALALPFPEGCFTAATVAFGLRNVVDLDAALGELARILTAGGRLLVLEFALPESRPVRGLYLLYFRYLLPWLGRLLSPRGSAYSYLTSSVLGFPQRQELLARMAAAGFTELGFDDLSLGTVCLYSGRKPR